ncbi:ATPase component BioM of energizing module of biotin ECF transporter [hydrothermal vent metagenome]|uniref:ATPase component BioM of energizing module of biotin ECF transporter n=1 Tax=hydrothermal vent metagenome TaxID=652676 RepID=A0A1W1C283_9ZZZZ
MIEPIREKQQRLLNSIRDIEYKREAFKYIDNRERMVGLIGSRGVGKTTLLLQYIKQFDLDEALYFSADDLLVFNYGIYAIVDEFYSFGGRIVAIDEVHRFKNWSQHLKNIYDSFPDLTIRISGSSMLNILYESHDLSRRLVLKRVNRLSFREYLILKEKIVLEAYTFEEILDGHRKISSQTVQKYPKILRYFRDYLQTGCYPYGIESEFFSEKLFNALEKIIYDDIPSLNRIKYDQLAVFKRLIFIIVSAKVPYKVSVDRLSKELDISEPTLYIYFDILNKTGIFNSVKKYSKKLSRKPDKLLFDNTNILNAYAKEYRIGVEIGTIRETFFASCFGDDLILYYSDIGDFRVDKYIFEVGGKNKTFKQIADIEDGFLVIDTDFTTHKKKIPLWVFGLIKTDK